MSATLRTYALPIPTLKASNLTLALFVTFGDGDFPAPPRSDTRYAILFVIFDDKKKTTLNQPFWNEAASGAILRFSTSALYTVPAFQQ